MQMSANSQKTKAQTNVFTPKATTSMFFSSYKSQELKNVQLFLEKEALFLAPEEKRILRQELKKNNDSLVFTLLREKSSTNLVKELKRFLMNFKKKENNEKNNDKYGSKKNKNKENYETCLMKTVQSERKPKEIRKVFITLTDCKENECKSLFFSSKPEKPVVSSEISTKISDFSRVLSFYESPKAKIPNINFYLDEIKNKILKNHEFIEEIKRCFNGKNYEALIVELFKEKDLYRISNSFFRYKLSPFFPDHFLTRLFHFLDLKTDDLLDINEIGLAFSQIFNQNSSNPINFLLTSYWTSLLKEKQQFHGNSIKSQVISIEEGMEKTLKLCDVEGKGFISYWDVLQREIQHHDLVKCWDFIG